MSITTNNHIRPFLYREQIPEAILKDQFDGCDEYDGFMKYRGQFYHLSEFLRVPDAPEFKAWHGYYTDSFFSGVVLRLSEDGEYYSIGTYIN